MYTNNQEANDDSHTISNTLQRNTLNLNTITTTTKKKHDEQDLQFDFALAAALISRPVAVSAYTSDDYDRGSATTMRQNRSTRAVKL